MVLADLVLFAAKFVHNQLFLGILDKMQVTALRGNWASRIAR